MYALAGLAAVAVALAALALMWGVAIVLDAISRD